MNFELLHRDPASRARAGLIRTDHSEIETPVFMPVGTAGSVKGIHQRELADDIEAPVILGNTYHLYLRPGLETLREAHKSQDLEATEKATAELNTLWQAASEELYKASQEQQAGAPGEQAEADAPGQDSNDDQEVTDVDFEEVK